MGERNKTTSNKVGGISLAVSPSTNAELVRTNESPYRRQSPTSSCALRAFPLCTEFGDVHQFNALITGSPLWGTNFLEHSKGRDLGALQELTKPSGFVGLPTKNYGRKNNRFDRECVRSSYSIVHSITRIDIQQCSCGYSSYRGSSDFHSSKSLRLIKLKVLHDGPNYKNTHMT